MPKPAEISAEKYQSLRARHAEAKAAREAIEFRRAGRNDPFSPGLNEAQCAEFEALIAAEQGGAAYNRSASDLESVRAFLEAELAAARKVLTAPPPAEPAPLASADAASLRGYVETVLAHRLAYAAHSAAVGPTYARLSLAYQAAGNAQQLIANARKSAGLYAPSHALPPPRTGQLLIAPPSNVEEIDRDLQAIAAQRRPSGPNGAESAAELRLRQLRTEHEEYEMKLAAEAEAARIEALPVAEQRLEVERVRVAAAVG